MSVMIKVSDIAILLVEKYKLTEEQAAQFIISMFDVINDGLQDEKLVKLKGLGTFKVTNVNSRESVNVNSGERIVIEGRDKICFTPEACLRDLVNGPFSQFETIVINDDVDFSDIDKKYEIKEEGHAEDSKEDALASGMASSDTGTLSNTLISGEEDKKTQQQSIPDTTIQVSESAPILLTQLTDLEKSKQEQKVSNPNDEPSVISAFDSEAKNTDEDKNTELEPAPSTQKDEQEVFILKENTPTIDKTEETKEENIALHAALVKTEPMRTEEDAEEQKEKLTELQTPDDSESTKEGDIRNLKLLDRMIKRGHHLVKALLVCVICMFFFGAIGAYYMMKQVSIRDHRIEYLEAWTHRKNTRIPKSIITTKSPRATTIGAEKGSTMYSRKSNSYVNGSQPSKQMKKEEQNTTSSNDGQLNKSLSSNRSINPNKKSTLTNRNSISAFQTYNKDPRIRTGAYAIIGIEATIKVKKGKTISSISRAYFGHCMECYMEALNGRDVKEGQTIKIPKLQLKKHR